jgi:hypothetical protein
MKFSILPLKRQLSILLAVCGLLVSHTGYAQETMRANLYVVNNSVPTLIDGNLTIYNSSFSNAVDWDDAWKLTNAGENFGIIRSNTTLVIERRSLIGLTDTTTFRMWNIQQRNYQIQFIAEP